MVKTLLYLVAGFVVYTAFAAKNVSNKLQYSFKDLKFKRAASSLLESQFVVTIDLFNPTKTPVNIKRIQGTAVFKEFVKLGDLEVTAPINLPGQGGTKINILIRVNNSQAIRLILNSIISKVWPVITLNGEFQTSIGNFPFKQKIQVTDYIVTE